VSLIEDGNIPTSQNTGEQDLGWMLYDMDYRDPENISPYFFKARMVDGIIDLRNVVKAS